MKQGGDATKSTELVAAVPTVTGQAVEPEKARRSGRSELRHEDNEKRREARKQDEEQRREARKKDEEQRRQELKKQKEESKPTDDVQPAVESKSTDDVQPAVFVEDAA